MSPSDYLRAILQREAVDTGADAPLRRLEDEVQGLCAGWAGRHLLEVYPTGAYEKGTANQSGTSIDFIVSLSPQTPFSMHQIYESLFAALERQRLAPLRRPVGIGLVVSGATIDIIPGKRESLANDVHEIYSTRRKTALKTNLGQHVLDTLESGRREEIRILKLWRDQNGLEFPSYYLELTVTAALRRRPFGELAENVWHVLGYLEQLFVARAVLDAANANNVVSEELTALDRTAIAAAAADARGGKAWSQIVV